MSVSSSKINTKATARAPVPYRSSRWPSRFLIWTGIGHTVVGFLNSAIRIPFIEAIQAGYFNQFAHSIPRRHSFWFFLVGINLIIMGRLVDWYLFPLRETTTATIKSQSKKDDDDKSLIRCQKDDADNRSDRKLPRELGFWFLGMATAGVAALPVSGIFLIGLQGLAIVFA